MKQIIIRFFLLASFFGILLPDAALTARAAEPVIPQGDFSELKNTGDGRVLTIIDPQTLQLADGRIIRLASLDLPDYDPHEPGELSLLAMEVLGDMLRSRDVMLYQTPKKDWGRMNRMGHHLAHIGRKEDGAWAQGVLLSLGLARVRTTARNFEMAAQMYALEDQARHERLGLWDLPPFQIRSPENAEQKINNFQVVEGKPESVSLKKNRVYINFGKNWRDDFTVSIPPASKSLFSKKGINPLQLNGKAIRVRGWLESYNGPYIEINHPEALEILPEPE